MCSGLTAFGLELNEKTATVSGTTLSGSVGRRTIGEAAAAAAAIDVVPAAVASVAATYAAVAALFAAPAANVAAVVHAAAAVPAAWCWCCDKP
jgi:hypothetical protein